MCSPSPPTPLPCRHQRPELILCGPGSTPVGDHLPRPPPAALMHREQLGKEGRALTGVLSRGYDNCGVFRKMRFPFPNIRRKLYRHAYVFFPSNTTWMIRVYELIKLGLWKIQRRLSETRVPFCKSAGFSVCPDITCKKKMQYKRSHESQQR